MTQESNDSTKGPGQQQSEATSKETLEDLEESEKMSDSDSDADHESRSAELPAPDGTPDENRKPDDAGPM